MKKYYFFVTFKVKFIRRWVNPSYDPEEWKKDRVEFAEKEVFGIKSDFVSEIDSVNEEVFFAQLKSKVYNAVQKEYVSNWIENNNKSEDPATGSKGWFMDRLEIENVSRVG